MRELTRTNLRSKLSLKTANISPNPGQLTSGESTTGRGIDPAIRGSLTLSSLTKVKTHCSGLNSLTPLALVGADIHEKF